MLGIGRTTLYRYEKGEREPDSSLLLVLQLKKGISIDWLLTGNRANESPLTALEMALLDNFKKMTPTDQHWLIDQSQRYAMLGAGGGYAEFAKEKPRRLKLLSPEDEAEQIAYAKAQVKSLSKSARKNATTKDKKQ